MSDQILKPTKIARVMDILLKVVSVEKVAHVLSRLTGSKKFNFREPDKKGVTDLVEFYYRWTIQWQFERLVTWKIKKLGVLINFHLIKRVSDISTKIIDKLQVSSFPNLFTFLRSFKISRYGTSITPVTGFKSCFPIEIWSLIVDFGADPGNLLRVNKELFGTFAPRLYRSIHIDIVLSSLDPLKLYYGHYVKHGGTYPYQTSDFYKLYERYQNSGSFDYEFLDTVHRNSKNNTTKSFIINDKGVKVYIETRIIKKFCKVLLFYENVLINESSIMKKFIKELSGNILVLNGMKCLLESLEVNQTIQSMSQDKNLKVIRCKTEPLDTFEHCLCYETYIERDKSFIWEESWYLEKYERCAQPFASSLFPDSVFFKELLILGVIFDQFKSFENRRMFSLIQVSRELQILDPFKYWNSTLDRPIYKKKGPARLKGPGTIKIENRTFFTKATTIGFLSGLMKAFSSKINDSKIDSNSSLFITGLVLNPDVNQDAREVGAKVTFDTYSIIINKAK
ncbi:hypothetical protein BN7_2992 [Wickerhamomyces ciferrii]|uniref:Uncharacterized protein n=1 Tax=Wickerhamomyces ciferrii (strain ATCC 14091 / BCRC 22168 / CBS 111 / JCM 3599 / NBRC 0793 / NRRL Y-1031 F-60-10) TaxID=1206466 RepID=K0KPU9_WICCF|nr:uncharacterized protein BN7_2992 [Wickerhamomyces ciferrii]CCH43444.1 hypothetical protein BN7_2992 [Wickerhamomyces ciferrii]